MTKLSNMPHTVRRVNTTTGDARAFLADNEREARKQIFYCATDNNGETRQAATAQANAAPIGQPYAIDGYVFTIEVATL